VAACSAVAAGRAAAQAGAADVERRGLAHGGARPPAAFFATLAQHPHAFEFRHGWLERARAVRTNRAALRAGGAWRSLNAPAGPAPAAGSATAVGGTLRYPTFMPLFSNTSFADSAVMDSAAVANQFWGTSPAPPYSITTYYQELSGGRLTVTGSVIGRGIRVSQTDTFYSGGPSCQGLSPSCAKVGNLIAELVGHADSSVDFSQFVDTATGFVPAIVILDPQVGGECYLVEPSARNSIWSHRWTYSSWAGVPLTTNDPWPGHPGEFVRIDDYIIEGGEGGGAGSAYPGCTPGVLAPIGTVTHETGHLFGLPDLYDTGNNSEGIGRWDLMSLGNERVPWRPAHMSAWSLAELGWVVEAPVSGSGTVVTGPIETTDTAFVAPIPSTSEYFLLENRQPIGSDSALYGPGLLVYHVDSTLIAQRRFSNIVNAVLPHGLALEQADGLGNLDCAPGTSCSNRGDAGDPYPGSSGNTMISFNTSPAATTNGGLFAGVFIDSIRQLAPGGAMSFRVTFQGLTVVAATDTAAKVTVDGAAPTAMYRGLPPVGSTHTIAIDSVQVGAGGRARYRFVSWSDGGARSHTITASAAGATITAGVEAEYLVQAATSGSGTISAARPFDPVSGTFFLRGNSVSLTATPGAGQAFAGWTGDTIATTPTLKLRVVRPYAVTATFVPTGDVVAELLTGAGGLTAAQLQALDQLGNRNGRFDLGDFVAWLDRNPGAASAPAARRSGGVPR
jgi:M6 family metalloprotease-like protein